MKILNSLYLTTLFLISINSFAANDDYMKMECGTPGEAIDFVISVDQNYLNPILDITFPDPYISQFKLETDAFDKGAMVDLLGGKPTLFIGTKEGADSNGGGTTDSLMLYINAGNAKTPKRTATLAAFGNVYQVECSMEFTFSRGN